MLQIKLIRLYYYVCQCYSTHLRWQVQRFSSNSFTGQITDEELLTIYLFCVAYQEKYPLKSMHRYIQEHWLDWFPSLCSYQTFVSRLNRRSDCLPLLVELLQEQLLSETGTNHQVLLVDSLPIPQHLGITPASVPDLTALRPILPQLHQRFILADKAYADGPLNQQLLQEQDTSIITPVKQVKGKCQALIHFDKAHDDLFSKAVSALKQPLESFFNWLLAKTNIQNASRVRSTKGLIFHVYAKVAAALLIWLLI